MPDSQEKNTSAVHTVAEPDSLVEVDSADIAAVEDNVVNNAVALEGDADSSSFDDTSLHVRGESTSVLGTGAYLPGAGTVDDDDKLFCSWPEERCVDSFAVC